MFYYTSKRTSKSLWSLEFKLNSRGPLIRLRIVRLRLTKLAREGYSKTTRMYKIIIFFNACSFSLKERSNIYNTINYKYVTWCAFIIQYRINDLSIKISLLYKIYKVSSIYRNLGNACLNLSRIVTFRMINITIIILKNINYKTMANIVLQKINE